MLVFNKYFYKNKKSKLCIGDRVDVLNDMFYEYEGSTKTKELPTKEFYQPSTRHVIIYYVFSQHARCPHHYPLYQFFMANSTHACNVLFAVKCCKTITLVSTFKFYL
jgi:hypothetical protein